MVKRIFRSSLFRSASVYTFANVINTSIPFLMLPVFTRYLSPVDYGIVATFQVLVGFTAPFISLGISGAISVKYYDKSSADLPQYITSSLAIYFGSTILAFLVTLFFRSKIGILAAFPENWIWAIVFFAAGQVLIDVALTLWQVQVKPVPYVTFQFLQSLSNIGLSVWLVVLLGMGWQGRLIAQVVVIGAFGLTGFYILWLKGWLVRRISFEYVKDILRFGTPLIPHMFGGWVIAATDRVFINNMVSVADTGLYAVAYQLTMGITFLQVSFNLAWVPWLYDKLSRNDLQIKRKIVRFTYGYVISNFLIALLLFLAAPWIFGFFIGDRFGESIRFIAWLATSRALMSMYYMTCNYIFYAKKTKYIAFSTVLAACFHVAALYVLIRVNGTLGAAQASVVSSMVLVSLVWYFANRTCPMPWMFWRARTQ